MIEIDGKIISFDVFQKKFVCDLNACKGACCVEGDAGAPLSKEEVSILDEIYPIVKPYMTPEGIQAVEEQSTSVIDYDNEAVTPLIDNRDCVYVTYENGITKCAIEKAWKDGKIDFPKPISCHLYPIRIKEYKEFHSLNYDKWEICKPACACGEQLQVPVYKFVKNALIRRYGVDFYKELEEIAPLIEQHFDTKENS